jgi:aspartyl-tRNA(Asn)/glutamyl-tRNA(Gln) amidotransferase subunit B
MDYRYFPEPDLPPLVVSPAYIEERAIDELPIDRRTKYVTQYGLQPDDARILSEERHISDYYETLVGLSEDPKKACSYITTVLFALFEANHMPIDMTRLLFSIEELAKVIRLVQADELSSTNAKEVISELFLN